MTFICNVSSTRGSDTTNVAQDSKAQAEIRVAFGGIQQAITRGDLDTLINYMSANTVALVSESKLIAQDPDAIDLDRPSQVCILLAWYAFWQLEPDVLKNMDGPGLLKWFLQHGLIQTTGLLSLSLGEIHIDGKHATADISITIASTTNNTLRFVKEAARWELDFARTLLSGEDAFRELRLREGLSKAEVALAALENRYRQPIPKLRELLLKPETRTLVQELKAGTASNAYDRVMQELSEGRQANAEAMLNILCTTHSHDQRIAFLQAVCSQSRFGKTRAVKQFQTVMTMSPATIEGVCARYMLELNQRRDVAPNMDALRLMIHANPENPLIPWLFAIASRDHYKLTSETNYSAEAVGYYFNMLEIFDMGPAMLHQTLANILSEELGRDEDAIVHRQIAVTLEPAPWTYQGLGNSLARLCRFDEANTAFAKLVEMKPDDPHNWYCWGDSLRRQKKYAEAVTAFQHSIGADPSYIDAYIGWGVCMREQRQYAEAVHPLLKALALDPHSYLANVNLGKAYVGLNRLEEAKTALELASTINPSEPQSICDLALVFFLLQLYDDCIAQARKAAAITSESTPYRYWGCALYEQGKLSESEEHLRKAIAINALDVDAHDWYGRLLLKTGRFDELNNLYEELLRNGPDIANAWRLWGRALAHQKRLGEAVDKLKRAVAIDPEFFDAQFDLGWLLQRQNAWPEATEQFRKTVALSPTNVLALTGLARCLCTLKAFEEAMATCEKAIELHPSSAAPHVVMAITLDRQGQYAESIEYCRNAVKIDPNNTEALSLLAANLERLGHNDESQKMIERLRAAARGTRLTP